jgi:hypothetical protein
MSDKPLATPYDAARLGKGDLTEGALLAASSRARNFTGQHISKATHNISARGPRVRLPARPVREVTAVTDGRGNPVRFELAPGGILNVEENGLVTVEYISGWDPVPDTVMEIICTIAARMESLAPGLAAGLQQEGAGGETAMFGWDSFQGVGGLVTSEKDALAKLFPKRSGLIVMRA